MSINYLYKKSILEYHLDDYKALNKAMQVLYFNSITYDFSELLCSEELRNYIFMTRKFINCSNYEERIYNRFILKKDDESIVFDENSNKYKVYVACQTINFYYNEFSIDFIKQCISIYNANYKRMKRLRTRIEQLTVKPCLFLTLTFNNKSLSYKATTRKQYIKEQLISLGVPYIANIDYGSDREYIDKNGVVRKATKREHYHAIVQTDFISSDFFKNYGNCDFERVLISYTKSNERIAKYISKLTNHALKESCRQPRIIYSKNF